MTASPENAVGFASMLRERLTLGVLLCCYVVMCCLSLLYVAKFYGYLEIFRFDQTWLGAAALMVVPFAWSRCFSHSARSALACLGLYLYSMILNYLGLVAFSQLHYDHTASASAFASALALLVTELFITSSDQAKVRADGANVRPSVVPHSGRGWPSSPLAPTTISG